MPVVLPTATQVYKRLPMNADTQTQETYCCLQQNTSNSSNLLKPCAAVADTMEAWAMAMEAWAMAMVA